MDTVLSRFYMARIGLRFLIEHHIESHIQREGFAGIIQSQCRPIEIVERAALDANRICTHHLGEVCLRGELIIVDQLTRKRTNEAPSYDIIQVARDGTRRKRGDDNGEDIRFTYIPGWFA